VVNQANDEDGRTFAQARAGDKVAFATLVDPHRLGLLRHCYRMLGSGPDAEDALQDTLLRAWQRLATFEARGSFQGWLYRIATNLCIDRLRGRPPKSHPVNHGPPSPLGSFPEATDPAVTWIEPIADESIGLGDDPAHLAEQREQISLAFIAALQRLSGRQRAALLLHDVLDFTHEEVAEILDSSPSAVNSLLFRARETMSVSPTTASANPDNPAVKKLLARYMRAWELADISEFVATVSADVRFSMPPLATWYQGSADVAAFIEGAIFEQARPNGVAMRMGRANGQPAIATYEPGPGELMIANGLQILDIDERTNTITGITSFRDPSVAIRCGLPATFKSSGNSPSLVPGSGCFALAGFELSDLEPNRRHQPQATPGTPRSPRFGRQALPLCPLQMLGLDRLAEAVKGIRMHVHGRLLPASSYTHEVIGYCGQIPSAI
jgi:RNA polymerase sigma-70 factor (ECF subfamily)